MKLRHMILLVECDCKQIIGLAISEHNHDFYLEAEHQHCEGSSDPDYDACYTSNNVPYAHFTCDSCKEKKTLLLSEHT